MKITLENTDQVIDIVVPGRLGCTVPARIWQGETESGIRVQCLITRIAALAGDNLEQFERELKETRPPAPDINPFSLRMIL